MRSRAGAATIARELASAREEVGRLSGQLREVRASNVRLQKELRGSVEERRRLTEEVLELRAAAEDTRPLQVSGALASQLEKELARGAAPGAVRSDGRIEDAAVLVRVLGGAPTAEYASSTPHTRPSTRIGQASAEPLSRSAAAVR